MRLLDAMKAVNATGRDAKPKPGQDKRVTEGSEINEVITTPSGLKYHRLRCFYCIGFKLVLAMHTGCSSTPVSYPDWTTYPADRTFEETQSLPPIGYYTKAEVNVGDTTASSYSAKIFSMKRTVQKQGDTAMHEVYIATGERRGSSEKALLSRVDAVGKTECPDDFRVTNTKYFYGPEATITMLGFRSPALRVLYRCSLELDTKGNVYATRLEQLSSAFPDSDFFDVNAKSFPVSDSRLIDGLKATLRNRGVKILKEKELGELGYIVFAGVDPSEAPQADVEPPPWRSPTERIVALIVKEDELAMIYFKSFQYWPGWHERGVSAAGTQKEGYSLGPQPMGREFGFRHVRLFIDELAVNLGIDP